MEEERLEQRVQLVTSKRLMTSVDEWRRRQEDIPSRSEAIRRLIELGLTASSNETKA
jgi:hypothetical protein